MVINKNIQVVILVFLVIVSYNFFDAQFLPEKAIIYSVFFIQMVITVVASFFILQRQTGFVLPVQIMIAAVLLSIPMAYLSWGQSLKSSLIEICSDLIWIWFFLLLYLKVSIKTIEKAALIGGGIYLLLYFFQLANAPVILFGKSLWGDEFTVDRNMVRIIFPGSGIFVLAIFISVNKLTTQKKGRWLWLLMTLSGILVPVLQVTRTFIAGVLLLYLYHFIKDKDALKKILIVGTCTVGLFFYLTFTENEIIKGILEALERDISLGVNYIRILSGTYFVTDFSPHFLNRILGNGAPSWGESYYGIFIEQLADRRGFYLEDVGIIGLYAMFGVFSVISWILIWIKSFTIPVPENLFYLKYYLWYILFTSLTSWNIYTYHFLVSTIFVVYVYHVVQQNTLKIYLEDGTVFKFFKPI